MKKQAVVIHSGGMDSSICLKIAIEKYGVENVLSLSFSYHQRHATELQAAEKICTDWKVDHQVVDLSALTHLTDNALMNPAIPLQGLNSLVIGRNGLMGRLGAIYAETLGAEVIYMGVIEVEAWNSGYRDCTRSYMDLLEAILRIDLNNPYFSIATPLVFMTKPETYDLADSFGILDYLIETTITCYEGLSHPGCMECVACRLRNRGLEAYLNKTL